MVDTIYTMNLIILMLIFGTARAANADVNYYHHSTIEFTRPASTSPGSYFGYSTTYDKFYQRLIISAPTEDRIGKVYECNVTTSSCSKIDIATDINHIKNYDHHYWFGATVRSGSTFLLACAPRATRKFKTNKRDTPGVFGCCYKRDRANSSFSTVLEAPNIKNDGEKAIELIMRPLGWSMDIAATDSIIVGGPSMYKKKGLAAILPNPKTANYWKLQRLENKQAIFNFGYSVALGYFLGNDILYYAVSSTYGVYGAGEVYFYEYSDDEIKELEDNKILKKEKDEDVVGSMFGAVLCAAHLDTSSSSTKPSDLIVGAPTYATSTAVNVGAVYVYIHKIEGNLPQYKGMLVGQENSFFGSAIVNVGDLNGDGTDEIAIGAPHEDNGLGAVYLYSGAVLATDPEKALLQKFTPKSKEYHSFGLSLSVLQDHDKNGCNELVIGAPYDGKVVVYSCFAAVTITKISTKFPKLQNRNNKTNNIVFQVCIHLQYPEKPSVITANLSTSVVISHPYAQLAHPNNNNMFTFPTPLQTKEPVYYQNVELHLPSEGKYTSVISYEISTKLQDDPRKLKTFDSTRTILSDKSMLTHNGAEWASDCAGEKCKPILDCNISSEISEPFVIGSKETETFRIDIENIGEVAYDPCVQIKVFNATLYQLPSDCSTLKELNDVYECTSRKPLKTNQPWTIDNITLNLKDLTSRHSSFAVDVTLFDFCKESKVTTKKYNVELKCHFEGLDVKGTTNIGEVINMNEEGLRDGKWFEHIYTITNNGMTNFENLLTEITIFKEEFISYPTNPVIIYSEDNQINNRHYCPTKSTEESSDIMAVCHIDSLPRANYFKVMISMQVKPESLEYNSLLNQNKTVTSQLIIKLQSFSKNSRIFTTIAVYETAVELWKILLAVFAGILLLIVLILVLQSCGCLKRSKKEELKVLKERVHRESIRRSIRPRNSDDNGRSNSTPVDVTCDRSEST